MDEQEREVRRLQSLAQGTSAVIWNTASNGDILQANPSWEAFTGQVFDDYRGQGWISAVHPEDRERLAAAWRHATASQETFAEEYRLRRHDGEFRFVRAQGTPVKAEGAVTEWIGILFDITDAIDARQALQRSELRFRFLDSLAQATRAMDVAAEIMAVTARMLGEYLGATRCAYADVDADNDRFTIRNDWTMPGVPTSAGVYSLDLFGTKATSNLRQGRHLVVRDVDAELGANDGADMFNAIGIKAIICAGLVKDSRLVAMMAVHQSTPRDWTQQEISLVEEVVDRCWAHIERVRDHDILREQDRRKDEFLATLAHELRNPLAPIKYALALMARTADPSRLQSARDTIDRQVSQMARLIDELLDLSRINRGLIRLQAQPIRIAEVVAQAVEAVRPLVEERGHALHVEQIDAGVHVNGDPTRLVQVIQNLLSNAAKYTPRGGQVEVRAELHEATVEISVSDNGLGIPQDQQHRLFEMFTQLEHTAAHASGGLGIGLALVKKLVVLHGGSVEVESAGADSGSTFRVRLPRAFPEVQPIAPGSDASRPRRETERALRVGVIEDNPDGRATLVQLLQIFGHEVRSAEDGQAALELLGDWVPDVLLLDLGLPKIDGLEVCRRLRARPEFRTTRVLALTGWGAARDREQTRAAGFDSHLTKPVEPEALQQAILGSASAGGERAG